MKKIKSVLMFTFIIFTTLSFYSFAQAKASKSDTSLEEKTEIPSNDFKSEIQNNLVTTLGATTTYKEGNYEYQIQEDYRITTTNVSGLVISETIEDIAVITKYNGNEQTVTIPKTLGGKRVYKIERGAFNQNTLIKKLIIPDNTVGYIGEGAFADCINLVEVSFGKGIDNISYYAFQHTALNSVEFPETLSAIRNTAFFECEKLTKITIDAKNVHLTAIYNVIYDYNPQGTMTMILYPYAKKDKAYTVPEKVESIYTEAIMNNYLETLTLSSSVKSISTSSYALTTPNLKNINVNSANKTFSSINGVLFSKDKKTLYYYPAGKTGDVYAIPGGTTNISSDAFFKSRLKKVTIPNTVTTIELEAFGYMENLEEITIPSSVTLMEAQIFEECPNLKKATINANAEVLPYLMFKQCGNLEEVTINGKIKTIIQGAFYYCTNLTKIKLPDSLEKVEFGAFWDCWNLENVTIPAGTVLLEECAFYDHRKVSNGYWANTKLDISKTQLKKQEDGSYMAAYYYDVQGTRLYDYAYKVLDLVNEERKNKGLKPITMDKSLLESAMQRAEELVVYFDHERPNGYDYSTAITKKGNLLAENIAIYQQTPEDVMKSWMNSTQHKDNILRSYYDSIGIGCYRANDGKYYWVQEFMYATPETVTKPKNKETTPSIQVLINKIPYKDVKTSDWHYSAVKYNVINKIILGYNATTFAPEDKITRAMIVTILHRMEGYPYVAGKSKYPDVQDTNKYYYVAVKWATENNIVNGYENGKFRSR